MSDILKYRASQNGRFIKEDGTTANVADMMEAIYKTKIRNDDLKPRLLTTINYSEFTAGASIDKYLDGVLSRTAKERTFIFVNEMNQGIGTTRVNMYESTLYHGANDGYRFNQNAVLPNVSNMGQLVVYSSTSYSFLASNVDSIGINLTIGTTAPTSGKLSIYVLEEY